MDELSQGILGREEDLENYILRVPNLVTSGGMKGLPETEKKKKTHERAVSWKAREEISETCPQ